MRLLIFILLVPFVASSQVIMTARYTAAPVSGCSYLLDTYSGATAAYSLRKLKCAYGGSAIRVRRSSDNTESDIGFTANGDLDTATMKTFVSSNDGFIVTWYDQSGSNNATMSTAANQAGIMLAGVIYRMGTNNVPTANFDGTDRYLLTSTLASNADFSIFDVRARSATTNEITTFSNDANSAPYAALQFTDGNVYATDGGNYVGGADALVGIRLFVSFRISGTLSIYRNGSSVSGLSGAFGGASTFDAIGKRGGTVVTGKISEMIYYNSDKSSSRTSIESNINTYYGVY